MSNLNVGTLSALLDLDTNPFEKKLLGTETTAKKAGQSMTRNLSLPLAAVGVAATKMSLDFEKIFSRMQGLAGVASGEVEGLKKAVMDLAGETGKGPQELAEALYFIRSAGIDGQAALDALEMSAKGAAAGLGETVAVADAVTSAMNGYGKGVLSAAEATDVLVATAREGKAEASQLAPQFGRLIPVAAELGITFDQVGAGLAFLSRSSGDASLSATQLDGVMQKLLRPSQQGAQALADVGMSVDAIRTSIRERGLLVTLQELRERLGDSGFTRFFDDVQGLQGALMLTGASAEEAEQVFAALEDSVGATDEAFAKWSETIGFKNQKAFAQLQASLIKLGDTLVPLMGRVADFASAVLEWFAALDDGSRAMVVTFGVFVAAMGPAITVAGRLTTAVKAMGTAYAWAQVQAGLFTTGGLGAMNLGAIEATGALVAAGVAVKMYGDMLADARREGEEWAQSVRAGFDPTKATYDEIGEAISDLRDKAAQLRSEQDDSVLGRNFHNKDFNESMRAGADGADKFREELEALQAKADELAAELGITGDEALRLAQNQEFMAAATDNATGAFDEEAAAIALATQELQGHMDALSGMFDPIFAMQDAITAEADARARLNEVIASGTATAEELAAAQDEVTRSMVDTDSAALRLQQAVLNGDVSMEGFRATLDRWVAQNRIAQEDADILAGRVENLTGKADEYAGPYTATFIADTSTAEDRIAALKHSIATVPRTVPTGFIGPLLPGQSRAPSRATRSPDGARAAGGPVWPGRWLVGEDGPEVVDIDGVGRVHNADVTARMLGGGGGVAPSGESGGGSTFIDQSRVTNQITTGVDAAEVVAVLDRYTRNRYGTGFLEAIRKAGAL